MINHDVPLWVVPIAASTIGIFAYTLLILSEKIGRKEHEE